MIVTLKNISKSYGGDVIFQNLNWVIENEDKIALVGPNGAGKSTLLNIVSGDLEIDDGELSRSSNLRIGYFKQNSGLCLTNTIGQEMRDALKAVFDLEKEMQQIGLEMSGVSDHTGETYHALQESYNRLQAKYDAADGYNAEVRINTILTGMGFGSFSRATVISTLSGGERTRLSLAKLLLQAPDLLILDEATNHLDFKTLIWLEDYLKSYKGAIIAVSHDRYFLDKVTTKTIEIEQQNIVEYPASYSGFVTLKADRLERMQKDYEYRMAEVARLQDYHDRNIVRATTAASAKSRLRMIEHLDDAPPPPPPPKPPFFQFDATMKPVKDVLDVSDLSLEVGDGYSSKQLLSHFNLHVFRDERVAIIGENGVGKSSLLKALVGKLPIQKGEISWGRNVKVTYFDQEDGDLHMDKTALHEIWDRHPTKYELEIRNLLGSLRLTQEDVYKNIGVLSGGEKAKVKLGILSLEKANLMILDEPTNHLDIQAKEALDDALKNYDGTLILVSHDRYLLNHIPTRIIEIFPDKIVSFHGGFDDYMEYMAANKEEKAKEKKEASDGGKQYYRSKKQRSQEVAQKKRIQKLEEDINAAEERMAAIQEEMLAPEVAADFEKLSGLTAELTNLQESIDEMFMEWSALSE